MRQRLFKMYNFDRNCIENGTINPENLDQYVTTLNDSFLLFALEKYKDETLEDGQFITEIIKVMLPANEDDAKHEWEKGLIFNGYEYYAWFATTNGMKKENGAGKCETIFIREDYTRFAQEFEHLISLGKFKEIADSGEEICINKDVLSRISLATSSSCMAGDMPNTIVLPQPQYRIIKDYKTVKKVIKRKDDKDVIDYDLVDHHFDDKIDVFDGGGVATPNVFMQIQEELKLKYPVEFAIIRGYGVAMKGMITKFNIIGYLDEVYKGDTPYYRKVNGQYQLLDMWKEWQTVTDNTILLNESMVKLAKYYDAKKDENWSTYKKRLSNVDAKYRDIVNKLYVTKVNKHDEEIEDYRRTNYQLINALAISKWDYIQLIKEDVRTYKKIVSPFERDTTDEWIINADAIRLFFKNIVNHVDDEEIDRVNLNIATKTHELLNISEEFVKLKTVKNNLASIVKKRSRDIACGKFTIKAKYQYIGICPISYINFAMYRDQGDEGLQSGQFYSGDCNNGDVRTIARNPLCAYSEVHNVTFVRNKLFDNWLSSCRELIYFNQKSDILSLMSGADTDGDAIMSIDNEMIKRSVVVPQDGKYFINTDDGQAVKMKYTTENRFISTYRASGNLIGSISLKSAYINSLAQHSPAFYDTVNDTFFRKYDVGVEQGEREAYIQEKLDNGEWTFTRNPDISERHRKYVKKRFYEYEKDIYIVLYNSMVAIDAPKTLYFPSNEDMKILDDKYYKKAAFLKYKENEDDVNDDQYKNTFGLLDSMTWIVENRLLDKIKATSKKFEDRSDIIQSELVNVEYDVNRYSVCLDEISDLYSKYTNEREEANRRYMSLKGKENKRINRLEREGRMDNFEDAQHKFNLCKFRADRNTAYKVIDAKYLPIADVIISKYDMSTVANVLGNLKNCTEGFIINLFYPVFEYLNSKLNCNRYVYKKGVNGDIKYLHENYIKIPVANVNNRGIVRKLHIIDKQRLKLIDVKADIRAKVLNDNTIDVIETEFNNNGKITFDVKVKENRVILTLDGVDLLGVFNDQTQIDEYNLFNCSKVKAEMLVDIAKSRKSLKLTVTEIVA
ncbi:hypothetical protein AB1283_04115 [Bacillus sp. S13(2024)]|uniref:hypothetical protein n=1 Tax=unclassified Bacillus (in: firmicutes) TaxID=185979 RepID=UPI003D198D10